MRFEIIEKPFAIIIRDFFENGTNKLILNESRTNKGFFTDATIGKGLDKSFRSNMVAYYDTIYLNRRQESVMLKTLDEKFKNTEMREVLSSSPYPVCDFGLTTYHETQVSRYGGNAQKYDWHIDRFDNFRRHITIVYYFFKEPKKFKGGELLITTSPIYNGKTLLQNSEIKIIPENNMALIFGGSTPHCVMPTTAPKNFVDGRFSANIWVGFQ